ncbi:MAG: sigma-70 family RNA polymerase sigma factor [Pseudomonadota bacterium]
MSRHDDLYTQAGEHFAPAILRLAQAVEHDAEKARDLEQDIHAALWQSLGRFDEQCALKTWVYRVAHNVAADHVRREKRSPKRVPLEEIETLPDGRNSERDAAQSHVLGQVRALIRQLPPLDAQVILLWLEGETGAGIAEITGLSVSATNVRIHRIKHLLAAHFEDPQEGASS